jgi:hypothetical protein
MLVQLLGISAILIWRSILSFVVFAWITRKRSKPLTGQTDTKVKWEEPVLLSGGRKKFKAATGE